MQRAAGVGARSTARGGGGGGAGASAGGEGAAVRLRGPTLIACFGGDAARPARKQRAMEAGGHGAAAAALQAHPGDADVQRFGQRVIDSLR